MINLFTKQITDVYIRKNFLRLQNFIREENVLKSNFKFFTMALTAPSYPSTVKQPHLLGYLPKDAIVTSNKGTGAYTLEYNQFDNEYIYVTITGPVELRMFLGTYSEGRTV